jgi:DNA-binding NtrC family response regulator
MGMARRPILVVEDDQDIRQALGDLLADEGLAHHLASCPDEAVAQMKRLPVPALILTDLFPDRDGCPVAALQRLRAAAPSVPLVVMTAAVRHIVDRVRADVTGVLSKPFAADAVVDLVRRLRAPD